MVILLIELIIKYGLFLQSLCIPQWPIGFIIMMVEYFFWFSIWCGIGIFSVGFGDLLSVPVLFAKSEVKRISLH